MVFSTSFSEREVGQYLTINYNHLTSLDEKRKIGDLMECSPDFVGSIKKFTKGDETLLKTLLPFGGREMLDNSKAKM